MGVVAHVPEDCVIIDIGCAIASVILLCYSVIVQPARAECWPGWYVANLRPSGAYTCHRVPGGDTLYDGAGGFPDRTVDRTGEVHGRIYCTGGSHPIVVLAHREADARVVGCQR